MDRSHTVRYNLTCSTEDGRIADWIARQLVKNMGSEAVSAMGFTLEPSGRAKVLTVINNPLENPPYKVLETAKALGGRFGVEIVDADIVGEIPLEVVLSCAEHALSVRHIRPSQIQCGDGEK